MRDGAARVSPEAIDGRLLPAVGMLQDIADSADPGLPVPATPGWSVADVLAHLAIETDRYASEVEGHGTWSASAGDIAETNRRALADFAERDTRKLAAAIRHNVTRYLAALAGVDLDEAGHGLDAGLRIRYRHGAGVLLGELLVHGHDLARASRRQTTIDGRDAAFIIDGLWQVLPAFADPDRASTLSGTLEVRLRGFQRLVLRLHDGTVSVTDGDGRRPDAVVSADPAAFLLLMYGRRSQAGAILRLQVVAWGRRPQFAFMLRTLFANP